MFVKPLRRALALALLAAAPFAMAVSNFSAQAPAPAKAARVEQLVVQPAEMAPLRLMLGLPDEAEIAAVKAKNAQPDNKVMQIGIGREVPPDPQANSAALAWRRVPGGIAAHWEITSPGAAALRIGLRADRMTPAVEIRFSGQDAYGAVYGPVGAAELLGQEGTYWSPVLEGERALVEVFVREGGTPADTSLAIAQVSHLFVSPTNPDIYRLAKLGPGTSGACEVDIICRAPTDQALANVGKAVAMMTFTPPGGGTSYCTGTLLNPQGGSFTPYFYSAAHCISTQASATTLTTHWFFDRTSCGAGVAGPNYVQIAGGAALLYANTTTDVLFMRLNATPPAAAVYAGWDAATLSNGVALTGVHHPNGDWKKVSLATMGGFSGYGGGAGSDHLISLWNSTVTGVTEPGSSGSGIFSGTGQDYLLRGGLHGGPSSCSATGTGLRDYYSRFDQAFGFISQYLVPPSAPGMLSFVQGQAFFSETAGSAVITVQRTGGASGTVSVAYQSSGGTATSGVDFLPVSGTLTWGNGDASPKTITVPLIADAVVEPAEYFYVQLQSPTGGATIGGFNPFQGYINDGGVFPPAGAVPARWVQSSGANFGWVVASDQYYEGSQSLKSALPSNTNVNQGQRADIEVTMGTGAGNVSFARKVSSEASFDYLRFYVDGVEKGAWSGDVAFSVVSFPVTQGYHTFRWSYQKDGSIDALQDTAWIDAVTFPPTGLDPAADLDNDGIPNGVEAAEGRNPFAKDNDVFSPGATASRLFAMQQYRDFLGREGDEPGIAAWANLVAAGLYSRPQVIDAFVTSPEFGGFVAPVVRLYFATFLRVPDYAGLNANAGLVRAGTVTLKQLADYFTTSAEFMARYGSLTNPAFVSLLYQNVLGRAADPGGLAAWVALLDGGMSRGQVLLGFSDSSEYQAAMANEVLVTMMYAGMLRRTPEGAGFNAWVGILDAGTWTREQVINGFFLSTEYRARFLP